MSYRPRQTGSNMNATSDLIRPQENPLPPTPLESQFWKFEVQCLACGSYRLHLQTPPREPAAPATFWLVCPRCGHREKMPLR